MYIYIGSRGVCVCVCVLKGVRERWEGVSMATGCTGERVCFFDEESVVSTSCFLPWNDWVLSNWRLLNLVFRQVVPRGNGRWHMTHFNNDE